MLVPWLSFLCTAGPTVGLSVSVVGLSDGERDDARATALAELEAAGVSPVEVQLPDPACAVDAACLEAVRVGQTSAFSGVVSLDLLRVGPVLQLGATAVSGGEPVTASGAPEPAALRQGLLLPDEVVRWARSLATRHVETARGGASLGALRGPVPPAPAHPGLGWVLLASGGTALAAGAVVAGLQEAVLDDPGSSGADKEGARTLGIIGLAAVGAGVLAASGGAVLLTVER